MIPALQIADSVEELQLALGDWNSRYLERTRDGKLLNSLLTVFKQTGMLQPSEIPVIYHNNNKTQSICALSKIDGNLHARIAEECTFAYNAIIEMTRVGMLNSNALKDIIRDVVAWLNID